MRKLEDSLHVIASMISTPISPSKIENTFRSVYHVSLSDDTIDQYISWCEEAYLLSRALRYDVKGRRHIGSPYKIYFEDIGIRNAVLNFRDVDQTDLIENVVYNELRYRGYRVDVGTISIPAKEESGKRILKDTEVDFVACKGSKKCYVQVAYRIDNENRISLVNGFSLFGLSLFGRIEKEASLKMPFKTLAFCYTIYRRTSRCEACPRWSLGASCRPPSQPPSGRGRCFSFSSRIWSPRCPPSR